VAPRSRITTLRAGIVRGRARDRGCRGVVEVLVSVGRLDGRRCRFLRADGRFGPRASCRRPRYVRAAGTDRWRFRLPRLAPGRYVVRSRAVDAGGNVEPRRRSGNVRRAGVPR
jgi:hypothetical protein